MKKKLDKTTIWSIIGIIACVAVTVIGVIYANEVERKQLAKQEAYNAAVMEEEKNETIEQINLIKKSMKGNRYKTALEDYSKKEIEVTESLLLDSDLKDEYRALYDEIIYGLFFIQYDSITEAQYFGNFRDDVLSDYVNLYEGVKMEQLSLETKQAIEEVVPDAVQRSKETISEINRLLQQAAAMTKDTKAYIGRSKESVTNAFGFPSEIEAATGGFMPEDRVKSKEIWYYRENGNLVMQFTIGKNGEVIDGYTYK
ncbi:hypothetical protein NSQ62_08000 [Solibacillus sp. FSL H8-0523]|uniref:hypothetical protein n=1 Tax=Solibacillus sp. FSL H8-0523 TaxID=2954511 RepID=UPI003100DEB0